MTRSQRISRLGLLVVGASVAAVVGASGRSQEIGPFGGPLFGLEASRHGKLLVADASVGIIPVRRGAPIPLPGVTDVSVDRHALWAVTGAGELGTEDTGQGVHVITDDGPKKVANLFEFEAANNPHESPGAENNIESNPFDVHALGWHAALVADAAGNDLLRVDRWGNVKVLATFPTEIVSTANIKSLAGCTPEATEGFCGLPEAIPAQAVPTSIAVDRRGYIYVGELKGFPAPTGESNIWRVSPHAENAVCGESPDCVKVFDGGFTSIIDLAFGPDGRLYVVEFDEASWAAVEIFGTPTGGTINACEVKWGHCRKVARDIPELTAIAFDDDGDLWATRHALVPGEAEVIEIRRRHDQKRHWDHRWSWRKHD